uniref:Transcription factor 23 n=1 Tax=Astyanax mexicanus TaxID=7994 RepID=A0A8B9H6I2_ASTMX
MQCHLRARRSPASIVDHCAIFIANSLNLLIIFCTVNVATYCTFHSVLFTMHKITATCAPYSSILSCYCAPPVPLSHQTRPTAAVQSRSQKVQNSPENAARERSRVRNLRQAFQSLQAALPSVPPDTKLSKLDVLVLATNYIAHLTETLDQGGRLCDHPALQRAEAHIFDSRGSTFTSSCGKTQRVIRPHMQSFIYMHGIYL